MFSGIGPRCRIQTSRSPPSFTSTSRRRFVPTPSSTPSTIASSGSCQPPSFSRPSRRIDVTWRSPTGRGWSHRRRTRRSRRPRRRTTSTSSSRWRPRSASAKFCLSPNLSKSFSEIEIIPPQPPKTVLSLSLGLKWKIISFTVITGSKICRWRCPPIVAHSHETKERPAQTGWKVALNFACIKGSKLETSLSALFYAANYRGLNEP